MGAILEDSFETYPISFIIFVINVFALVLNRIVHCNNCYNTIISCDFIE